MDKKTNEETERERWSAELAGKLPAVHQISSSSVHPTTDLRELLATPPIAVTTCLDLASASQ